MSTPLPYKSWPRSGHNIIILAAAAANLPASPSAQTLAEDLSESKHVRVRLCRYYIIIFGYYYIAIIVLAGKSIIELRHTNPNDHSNHVLNRNALTLYRYAT